MGKYEKKEKKPEKKLSWQENVVMYLHDLVFLLCAVMVLFLVMFRIVIVSGDSMRKTLVDGDYLLLISSVFYREPEQGDIIVVSKDSFDDGAPIVKRVIATEGQTVDIDFEQGIVYVDGIPLDEPYTNTPTNTREGTVFPLVVAEDCVFAMGDNRNKSRDSRDPVIGQIDRREILGKAIYLFLPGSDKDRQNPDFSRIGAIK